MTSRHSDVLKRVVLAVCESIDSPRALSTWLCMKYNQAELLNLLPVDPADNNSHEFLLSYFLSEYLSKYKGLKSGIKTREVALGRWISSEQQCFETNKKFREYVRRPFDGRAETVLFRTQRLISMILGPLNVSNVLADCKLGPGATFDLRRGDATPDQKYSRAISVTASALPYFKAVLEADPHWCYCFLQVLPEGPVSLLPQARCFQLVRGSRFLTVPKSAKTDRCIAAEPTGNQFLQQGVHSFMRRRLRRYGVDLSNQELNQRAARSAYLSGYSTLDLSAASDTISRELVYHLLPLDWAMFLDSLRSQETLVDGEWIRTEKFASMGNAFCFELETLIFYALCRAIVDEGVRSVDQVIVYGDDIIVPRKFAPEVIYFLTFCGFTVNDEKSHIQGNFFESCGKHYHRSLDVTPVYQKEVLDHPSEIIRAHNRLYRFAVRSLPDGVASISKALKILSDSYPKSWPFPRIPDVLPEDGGFLRPLSEFSLDPNRGYRCRVLDFVPSFQMAREDALYAYKLRLFPRHSRRRDTLDSLVLGPNEPSNSLPTGHAEVTTKGTWRTRVRWVHESSVLSWTESRAASR